MLWSDGENAGFSSAKPWNAPARVRPGINVKAETENPDSLLSHYRRLIKIRNNNIAMRRGDYRVLRLENKHIFAYLRSHAQQVLLVLHNFSAEPQPDSVLPADLKLVITREITAPVPGLAPFATQIYEVKAAEPGPGK
jgi:glycosidase